MGGMDTGNARALRKNLTDAEKRLWQKLKRRQIGTAKFRRQQPIGDYIIDFACLERRLIVELDGGQHATQVAYDDQRTAWLESRGYRVLRFWNNDVLANTDGVVQKILIAIGDGDCPPIPTFPLKGGRGLRQWCENTSLHIYLL